MATKEIALENEILRGVVGSTAHGLNIEGQDDHDEMGIFIEPAENVCGLTPVDHYIYRDQPNGVRSQPGDLDLTLYSLRKFCRLAAKGNPSVMILLWLPEYLKMFNAGKGLVGIRDAFISKEAGKRFLGYLTAQKRSLTGQRAQKVNRPELIEKYGFDVKFAFHALRLGFEGIELLTDRRITLPVRPHYKKILMDIRTGKINFNQTVKLIEDAENKLRELVEKCEWKADTNRINQFMIDAHRKHWG